MVDSSLIRSLVALARQTRYRPAPLGGDAPARALGSGWSHHQRSARRCTASAAAAPVERSVDPSPELPASSTPVERGTPAVTQAAQRRDAVKNPKPFSDFLTDTFQRQHDYLRISITERCNLRCLYCMPEEGVPLSPPSHLLTNPEIFQLSSLFVSQGVRKIRLTGGEPTIRKDLLPLMHSIGSLRPNGLRELCITTNGISLHRKLDSMLASGLTGVNLSLDTLDPFQFQIMTRRKGFDAVIKSIDRILEMNRLGAGIKLKINCVVMRGVNEREILPFIELGREKDLEVRFIEYMPFDGNKWSQGKMLSFQEMLSLIRAKYPTISKVQDHKNDTSKTYAVPGFAGRFGFITSMTHNFCGTCNRLRITSDGNLKVCLFGNSEVSLRDLLRESNGGQPIDESALEDLRQRGEYNQEGLLADPESAVWSEREMRLLEVIGMAVKRKKAKHAGMGQLENMKNRPMILIGGGLSVESVHGIKGIGIASSASFTHNMFQCWLRVSLAVLYHELKNIQPRFQQPFSTSKSKSPISHIDAPFAILSPHKGNLSQRSHFYSTQSSSSQLPHLTPQSTAHMIGIISKPSTSRLAIAHGTVLFNNEQPLPRIRSSSLQKGDVLAVARIAGIMAAKRTPELIPLCHPLNLSGVDIDLDVVGPASSPEKGQDAEPRPLGLGEHGGVHVKAKVECQGPTGVEMEALTGVMGAALTIVDMCKGVDRGLRIEGVRVVLKRGGRSGEWREKGFVGYEAPTGGDIDRIANERSPRSGLKPMGWFLLGAAGGYGLYWLINSRPQDKKGTQ
ncbi:MAG: hypothetical protein M4579_005110 [Chaenotheca gracillima]|nr:MAG: hypothetical protein M4579_005110 [Chaenotheca gracillima]